MVGRVLERPTFVSATILSRSSWSSQTREDLYIIHLVCSLSALGLPSGRFPSFNLTSVIVGLSKMERGEILLKHQTIWSYLCLNHWFSMAEWLKNIKHPFDERFFWGCSGTPVLLSTVKWDIAMGWGSIKPRKRPLLQKPKFHSWLNFTTAYTDTPNVFWENEDCDQIWVLLTQGTIYALVKPSAALKASE